MSDNLRRSGKKQVVLGSGDKKKKSQQFKLPKGSLTSSRVPNIIISVNNIQWTRVDTLSKSSPNDRHYVIRREEGDVAFIQFGDGVHGARLPTGTNNVAATYRTGVGAGAGTGASAGAGGNIQKPKTKRKRLVKKEKIEKKDNS